MRKVLFLIVLNKGTYASNATIVINASLCFMTIFLMKKTENSSVLAADKAARNKKISTCLAPTLHMLSAHELYMLCTITAHALRMLSICSHVHSS